jgi:hypothetical protein
VPKWPTTIRCFKGGGAHLTADTIEELHVMAEILGMRREWFQDGRVPHYDLTPKRRTLALSLGVMFVPAKEQARKRIAKRTAEAKDA